MAGMFKEAGAVGWGGEVDTITHSVPEGIRRSGGCFSQMGLDFEKAFWMGLRACTGAGRGLESRAAGSAAPRLLRDGDLNGGAFVAGGIVHDERLKGKAVTLQK